MPGAFSFSDSVEVKPHKLQISILSQNPSTSTLTDPVGIPFGRRSFSSAYSFSRLVKMGAPKSYSQDWLQKVIIG